MTYKTWLCEEHVQDYNIRINCEKLICKKFSYLYYEAYWDFTPYHKMCYAWKSVVLKPKSVHQYDFLIGVTFIELY